ncbi:MAG: sugar phosphate isomerase/epimerase [Verrucomicrobia bacterium]|nr:sugar phosphate isomerase/epimerase [Verrucomicrobiota bacterium]
MLISVSSVCWFDQTVEDAARKARDCGFTAFEALTFPRELFPLQGDLREVAEFELPKLLDRHGLTLAGLHLGSIGTSSEALRRSLTDYAKFAITHAKALGCDIIVEGGPDRAKEPFTPFLKSIAELIPVLEKTGVKLALENHYLNWIQYIQDYEHIFQHVDHPLIGITLDTGHFTSAGVDSAEVVRTFPDKIFHVHVKDHKGTQSLPLGHGVTDNAAVVRELKNISYRGYLSQELEVPKEMDGDQAAKDGFAYMTKLAKI